MAIPNVRCEVAFASQPDAVSQTWTDVTPYLLLSQPVSINRGRGDEFGQVQPSTLSLTLDNSDGRFTVGRAASPYYPNVKIGRQIRVFAGSRVGNLLSAEAASFEGGTTGGWVPGGTAGAALANSTTQAQVGTKSLRVIWNNSLQSAEVGLANLTIGLTYTASAYVYVGGVTGSSIGIGVAGISSSPTRTSWNNTWGRLSYSFTATASSHILQLSTLGATARTDYIDAVMVEEGSTLNAFTTTAPAKARFTGLVDEWPVEWAPGAFYAQAQVSATDRFKRLGQIAEFSNVLSEEIRYDSPAFYYPLGEDSESTTAGDVSAAGQGILTTKQINSGGTLEFGAGTGPDTDGLSAPVFTPVNVGNGKYLGGVMNRPIGFPAVTLRACALTSTAAVQTVARLLDGYGTYITIDTSAGGKAVTSIVSAFLGTLATVTGAATINNGLTHTLATTASLSGSTVTLSLFVDGVADGSTTYSSTNLPLFTRAEIGGTSQGQAFTGTISHVAGYNSALTAARLLQQHTIAMTGYSTESSDARLSRYARWAGITGTSFEAGTSTSIAHVDTTGKAPVSAMQDIVETESGLLFIDGAGTLTFHSRAHRYNAVASATFGTGDYGQDTSFKSNDLFLANDVTVSRDGGITYRAINAASIADYGTYRKSMTLLTTSDQEVIDAASWAASRQAQPSPRASTLSVDLLTSSALQTAALPLELGSLVALTGLPSSAPATTASLFVEGWSESISANEWTVTFNTSPGEQSSVFVLDDLTYGGLDEYPLAY